MVIPAFPNNVEMRQFIEKVYEEPYSLMANGCFQKSVKIAKKAKKLGKDVNLVLCWSVERPNILRGLPPVFMPHMYVEIEGEKVDVSYDPDTEEVLCANEKRITVLPIKLPKWRN